MSAPATIVSSDTSHPPKVSPPWSTRSTRRSARARLVIVNSGIRGYDSDPAFASATEPGRVARRRAERLGVEHEIRQSPRAPSSPAEEILARHPTSPPT